MACPPIYVQIDQDSCENRNVYACLDWRVFSAADLTHFSVVLFHDLYFTLVCLLLPWFLCCQSIILCLSFISDKHVKLMEHVIKLCSCKYVPGDKDCK